MGIEVPPAAKFLSHQSTALPCKNREMIHEKHKKDMVCYIASSHLVVTQTSGDHLPLKCGDTTKHKSTGEV